MGVGRGVGVGGRIKIKGKGYSGKNRGKQEEGWIGVKEGDISYRNCTKG